MLRRLGLRRILPIVQLAVFVALVAWGFAERRQEFEQRQLQQVALQQNVPLQLQPELSFPVPWLIAIVINVPAAVLGAMIAEIAHTGTNLGALICSTPFVLVLWHFIGRWIDRQLGILPMKLPGNLARVLCISGIVLAVVLFAVGVIALRSAGEMHSDTLTLAVAWEAWSVVLFVMCLFTLRRKRSLA